MAKMTISKLLEKKKKGERITMLTAYDYTFARLVDEAAVDLILVGDSLGMVVLGHSTTLPVSMEDMVRHTQAVSRGTRNALVTADMPFLSFQVNEEEAVRNAGRLIQEGGAEAVKLEGGKSVAGVIRRIVAAGMPVMGHLGLTPQSIHLLGGYKVQGKTEQSAKILVEDARLLEQAGCFSIVLECVPAPVAGEITRSLGIPVIGIGAGSGCDGQVLVLYDCLGLTTDLNPRFVKQFANLKEEVSRGLREYVREVREGTFPSVEQSFS